MSTVKKIEILLNGETYALLTDQEEHIITQAAQDVEQELIAARIHRTNGAESALVSASPAYRTLVLMLIRTKVDQLLLKNQIARNCMHIATLVDTIATP